MLLQYISIREFSLTHPISAANISEESLTRIRTELNVPVIPLRGNKLKKRKFSHIAHRYLISFILFSNS